MKPVDLVRLEEAAEKLLLARATASDGQEDLARDFVVSGLELAVSAMGFDGELVRVLVLAMESSARDYQAAHANGRILSLEEARKLVERGELRAVPT